MNALKKNSAVAKYGPAANGGKTLEELKLEIAADEKNYTAEEIDEIMAALGDPSANLPKPAKKDKAASKKDAKESDSTHYSEWEVKITNREAEKLKVARHTVKITDEEAATLNAGVLHGSNTYARMYFKAD